MTEVTDWLGALLGFAGGDSAIASAAQNDRLPLLETKPQCIHGSYAVAIAKALDVTLLDSLTDASIEKLAGWHEGVA
jgi:hypothetical protein